jgi:hypothetical protein
MDKVIQIKQALQAIPDPRSKQGVSHSFHGILALVLLGLLARQISMTHIAEWAKLHWNEIKEPFGFENDQPPNATTLSRTLAKIPLDDLQKALILLFRVLLAEEDHLTVAVDGKTSKQFHRADGHVTHMLNLFVQDFNATLAEYSVNADKTNEEACLRQHAEDFFARYPFVQLLTGDAACCTRPLLQVLEDIGKDYLFCVKNNQPTVFESLEPTLAEQDWSKPSAVKVGKKGFVITHNIAVDTRNAEYVRHAWNMPNCRTLICKFRIVEKDGKEVSRSQR